MPMFYIGRSNVKNVLNGYRGSVSSKRYRTIWNEELLANPSLFETRILSTHKTSKDAAEKEEYLHKKFQVHKNPLYINQATGAGTFCADIRGKNNPFYGISRNGELNPMYGRKHSLLARKKMSKNNKGKHSGPKSIAHRNAISSALKGRSYEDLHGIDHANQIKEKLKKPKTMAHKQKQSEIMRNKPNTRCPNCGKWARGGNYSRWHGNNCKLFQEFSNKL